MLSYNHLYVLIALLICVSVCFPKQPQSIKNGYDGAAVFDPSGGINQIEYAMKAAHREHNILIAVKSDNCAVFISWNKLDKSVLSIPSKVQKLSSFMLVGSSGIVSDINHLSDYVFENVLSSTKMFGVTPTARRLATSLAGYMHEKSLSSYTRPFGVSLCLGSYDNVEGARLFEIDSSGSCRDCDCYFAGAYREKLIKCWANKFTGQTYSLPKSKPVQLIVEGLHCLKNCLLESEMGPLDARDVTIHLLGEQQPVIMLHPDTVSLAVKVATDTG